MLLSRLSGGDEGYLFNLRTNPEEIIGLQSDVQEILKKHDTDSKTVTRVSLLLEEMYLFIRKMNGDKAVLCECSVFLKPDGVKIISKDEGVAFDMADEDLSTVSLSSYIISSYLEKEDLSNRHLITMSFNRSSFFIKYSG